MKLRGIVTYLAVAAGSAENPKSDKDPKKRIEALGGHLTDWVNSNLCRREDGEEKCLKSRDIWPGRIDGMAQRLANRYDKCGSIPTRSNRKRRDDQESEEEDVNDEEFNILSSPAEFTYNLVSARYARDNPVKAVSQLCSAMAKWTKEYLSECSGRRNVNGGHLQPVLRMAKWKILLHNAYIKAQKLEDVDSKSVPSSWPEWFQKKIDKNAFRK